MKKLGIMQSYFFPYIGYFQLLNAVDTFCLYEHVSYRKKSWINRNSIFSHQDIPNRILIPVQKKSSFSSINDIKLVDSDNWKSKLIDNIYYTYKKAPEFPRIFDFLIEVINAPHTGIHEYNCNIITKISQLLDCDTEIITSSSTDIEKQIIDVAEIDSKHQRVIKLCKLYDAKKYLNPIGGSTIYKKEIFEKFNIDLQFLKSSASSYKQFGSHFQSNLSIIDLLMFNSLEKMQQLLNEFKLFTNEI